MKAKKRPNIFNKTWNKLYKEVAKHDLELHFRDPKSGRWVAK